MLSFIADGGRTLEVAPEVFVIAGYTGRDGEQVRRHIDELAREGIAPPPEVPMLYEMPVEILTTAPRIEVPSAQSSGEVEPILVGAGGAVYLGIGSDHTARDVEREDIARSKRICPKPIGPRLAAVDPGAAGLDAIALESGVDGEPYQRGSLAQIAPLAALLERFRTRYPRGDFVLFCGTVPLLTHGFRFGRRFAARLHGGPLAAELALAYDVAG